MAAFARRGLGAGTLKMPLKSYLRPRTLDEALTMRESSSGPAAYIAGGTDLNAFGDSRLETVVDLSRLGLEGIALAGDVWRLGATTPLADIVRHAGLGAFADGLLPRTAALWRTSLLRERATLGGVLAGAHADSDLVAALVALRAAVLYVGPGGEKRAAIETFYRADGSTILGGGILTALDVPAATSRAAHERLARARVDATIVGAAAVATGNGWRIALCGVAERVVLVSGADLNHAGPIGPGVLPRLSDRISELISPPDDFRASAAYRRHLADVLARRVLARVAEAQR